MSCYLAVYIHIYIYIADEEGSPECGRIFCGERLLVPGPAWGKVVPTIAAHPGGIFDAAERRQAPGQGEMIPTVAARPGNF